MRERTISRMTATASLTLWAATVALLARVVADGPVEAAGLVFDRLTAVLAVLVVGVSAIVAIFASRYLSDDPRLGRFQASIALTTAGTVVFATAASLEVLVCGWLVATLGFLLLLAHRRDVTGGREALRRAAGAFAIGDAALLGAAGIALATVGSLDLREPAAAAAALSEAGVAEIVAVLLVVAALARCAQLPLHRWLPATIAAPTPVSALLHAGLVNAGGILLVRLGPVIGAAEVAGYVLLAAGAVGALYGGAVMLTRADVKGALAHSTIAQMGFMLVQVALGAASAAVVHLVGHAMYKAALFLGAGSAVRSRRRRASAPQGRQLSAALRAAAAVGLPLGALALATVAAGGTDAVGGGGALVLLAFAWASGAQAVDGWLRSGPPAALAGAAVASAVAAGAYVGLLAAAKAFLAPGLPAVAGIDAWFAAPLVLVVVAATVARVASWAPEGLTATAYAWLVDFGGTRAVGAPRRRLRLRAPAVVLRRPAGAHR
jgi:NADH:ubiquinone oxidoreductase subunit 5 (subunit L)/multisubunit Na+/H+ antiporter MnhA subunit